MGARRRNATTHPRSASAPSPPPVACSWTAASSTCASAATSTRPRTASPRARRERASGGLLLLLLNACWSVLRPRASSGLALISYLVEAVADFPKMGSTAPAAVFGCFSLRCARPSFRETRSGNATGRHSDDALRDATHRHMTCSPRPKGQDGLVAE